jgi:5-methylcytosine-specific restriction endonuclease McrA
MHVVMQTNLKFCKRCAKDSARYADGRCKTCVLARNAAWAKRNRDRVNVNSRTWNQKNREKKLQTAAVYRQREKDAINTRRKLTRQYRPELERLKAAKRRTQKRAGGGRLSKNIITLLLEAQQGLCACCKTPLSGAFHLDHKIPLSRGGTNTDDNVQLLLPSCNLRKYTMTQEEFDARNKKLALAEK